MNVEIDFNKQTVVPKFYLEKVLRCPYLIDIVQEMFEKGIKGYQEMYDELHQEKLFGSGGGVICCRVDNKKSGIFICHTHLTQLILGTCTFKCTSEDDKRVFFFTALNLRFCKSCILHYLRENYSIYNYVKFN